MELPKQMFIDGITNLNLTQGTFRFDLASFSGILKDEEGKTRSKLESHTTIIMTPQGFMQLVDSMQRFLEEVKDQNLIQVTKKEMSSDKNYTSAKSDKKKLS